MRANRQRKATRRQQETTRAREARCVSIRPGLCLCLCVSVLRALVACKKSLVAEEFSQHRHRSFRFVIASLQIEPTAQRRAQRIHLDKTLRTPPAHTHTGCARTDKDKLRGASRRQHKRQRRGVCVSIRPGLCLSVSVSVLRALVACKKVWLQMSFRSIVIVHHAADRKLQRETKPHGHHFAGVQRKDYVLLRLGSPQGMPTERGD